MGQGEKNQQLLKEAKKMSATLETIANNQKKILQLADKYGVKDVQFFPLQTRDLTCTLGILVENALNGEEESLYRRSLALKRELQELLDCKIIIDQTSEFNPIMKEKMTDKLVNLSDSDLLGKLKKNFGKLNAFRSLTDDEKQFNENAMLFIFEKSPYLNPFVATVAEGQNNSQPPVIMSLEAILNSTKALLSTLSLKDQQYVISELQKQFNADSENVIPAKKI